MNKTPKHHKNIITRQLPKTGQTVEYQAGDDGTYEAGWWKGRLNSNNKVRFVSKTIGGDVVVIDRATGLMWAADGNAAGCNLGGVSTWSFAVTYAEALTFAGFTDWRLPNVKELMSIVNYSKTLSSIDEPPFSNTGSNIFWTSTTYRQLTTSAWRIAFTFGSVAANAKSDPFGSLRCVRGGV